MTTFASDRIRLETFVGRATELQTIARMQAAARSWALRGGRRLGKTMLLRHVEAHPPPGVVIVYVDKQALPDFAGSEAFFEHMRDRTVAEMQNGAESRRGLDGLIGAVERLMADGTNWCLMLDETEALARQPWGGTALENLRHVVSNSDVAGAASIGLAGGIDLDRQVESAGSSILNVCRMIDLAPLAAGEIAALVSLHASWESHDVASSVFGLSGGHPYLAQRLLEERESRDLSDQVLAEIQEDAARLVESNMRHLSERVRIALVAAVQSQLALRDDDGKSASTAGLARPESGTFRVAGDMIAGAISARAADYVDPSRRRRARGGEYSPAPTDEAIALGESSSTEFKASLRWDFKRAVQNNGLEQMVVKTVCAFANSDGGTLLIGVEDTGDVLGLDHDYASLKSDRDGYELHLRSLLNQALGIAFVAANVACGFPIVDGREICRVDVRPGKDPLFVRSVGKNGVVSERFYIRNGNSSQELPLAQLKAYWDERFD